MSDDKWRRAGIWSKNHQLRGLADGLIILGRYLTEDQRKVHANFGVITVILDGSYDALIEDGGIQQHEAVTDEDKKALHDAGWEDWHGDGYWTWTQ